MLQPNGTNDQQLNKFKREKAREREGEKGRREELSIFAWEFDYKPLVCEIRGYILRG